jgi:hypothetical protein
MKKINSLITILCVMTLALWSGAVRAQDAPPTPFYSVTGTNGTGGGTTSLNLTPVKAPAGSTALVDLRGTTNFSFALGSDGNPTGAITNVWTDRSNPQVLAATLGAGGVLSNFTMTVWFQQPPSTLNNYRLGLISAGAPPTTGSPDGGSSLNKMFWGENSGGGFQFYVNNANGNSVGTSIAGPNTWNNNGVIGAIQGNIWYFIAITYHIDSNPASNSCVLYCGSQSNTCVQVATYTGGNGLGLGGPLDLSAATSICLMNNFAGNRCFPGEMDYFDLYTNVLTLNQITAVQRSQHF